MLLDIKNESQEQDEIKDFSVTQEDATIFIVGDMPKKSTLIALKELKNYSAEEEQFLIPSDRKIRNFSTTYDLRKSFFTLNSSWRQSMESIVKQVFNNTFILVNGVVNSGKSTFISCLVNQLHSLCDKEVFILDLDPGQPNYNLAG